MVSAEEFLQLPLAERKLVLGRLLVASEPIWIWDEGVMEADDDSIAEDATLLLQDCCTRSNQLSLDAQEVYYGQTCFDYPFIVSESSCMRTSQTVPRTLFRA